jgi:hypothetical protein
MVRFDRLGLLGALSPALSCVQTGTLFLPDCVFSMTPGTAGGVRLVLGWLPLKALRRSSPLAVVESCSNEAICEREAFRDCS